VLNLLSNIGGLFEALFGIGLFVVGFIAQKIFMSKIIKKVYHIRKYDNIDHELNKR
jgi:hypothetical protein